ncbi:exodeoxyribonuclease VII large subunit [Stackebrandtia nassauensis]|uniref:Exodeoxyribonuclease 7 large subunit n=1 Tax=Stackebrandtia nassauensis (strain DSM 44728 / CIP 108903 / NRRL B-16338 / NBRC 102104 / LLR-40K-21) TaxID=446470 RepID=D3PWU6_STANL|nr:exodeoxyribonuclease VII, large subunit [Stackebrandtia nassauensis DSM 44728]
MLSHVTQPELAAATGPSTPESPWPVRVVSHKIGEWISRLGAVWAEGQITQISRRPGAGFVFLTLRDPAAEVSLTVVTTRNVVDACDPPLRDGARVIVHGKPDWYPGRGTLSLRATEIRQVGLGELLARLEKLKKLLAAEGLFAPERKRPLPFLPRRIGLITGRASAAERDVLENAKTRLPSADFEVREVPVQGPQAVPKVLEALAELDADPAVEVIILARGGGSVEDLLPFSDETLCRAVFAAKTPIVSAIGHEPDNPLVDFVADVRCSTPTDAGKRVVPDFAEERRGIDQARHRLRQALGGKIDRESQALAAMRSRPCLAQPSRIIDDRQDEITHARDRIRRAFTARLDKAAHDVTSLRGHLRALSPQGTLDRGYAIVRRADGAVVRADTEVTASEDLRVRLARGELTVIVKE